MKLTKTNFSESTLRETRFIETILTEANFTGCDLDTTVFHHCHLEKASFMQAKNYSIDPTANALKGAFFSLPEAVSLLTKIGIELK